MIEEKKKIIGKRDKKGEKKGRREKDEEKEVKKTIRQEEIEGKDSRFKKIEV